MKKDESKSKLNDSSNIWKALLVILALVLLFTLQYLPHFNYKYPFHIDEWHHISEARTIEEQGIKFFTYHYFNAIEVGFQIILFLIDSFFPLVLVYKFLPALNAVIIACVLFYFLTTRYSFWAGFFSMLFLATIKSNINILGLWFYVPVVAATPFVYAFLFLLPESLNNRFKWYLSLVLLAIVAFVHTSSFLLIGVLTGFFYMINIKYLGLGKYKKYLDSDYLQKNLKNLWPLLIVIIPVLIIINNFWGAFDLKRVIFGASPANVITYNPFLLYGVLSSIFAFLGVIISLKKRKILPFSIYFLITLINILLFPSTNFTFFSAYQRSVYHFMIASVPLSALGLFFSLNFLYVYSIKLFRLPKFKKLGLISTYIIIAILAISSFGVIFYDYLNYEIDPRAALYTLIDDDDYKAMLFLKGYSPPSNFNAHHKDWNVLSPIYPGNAIPAVSRKTSFAAIHYSPEEQNTLAKNFLQANCSEQAKLINHNYYSGLRYVYSYKPLNCIFFEEIFRNDKVYLYKILRGIAKNV